MQGLEGVRVLELGNLVSAAYAAKLMADLGAEVIKVEEPHGDLARQRGPFPGGTPHPEKSGLYLALNTNKRSVTIDLRQPEGQERLRHTRRECRDRHPQLSVRHKWPQLGIDYQTFRALNPRLVMCSVTPFGLTGPLQRLPRPRNHHGAWGWLGLAQPRCAGRPGAAAAQSLRPSRGFSGCPCGGDRHAGRVLSGLSLRLWRAYRPVGASLCRLLSGTELHLLHLHGQGGLTPRATVALSLGHVRGQGWAHFFGHSRA